MFRVEKPHHGIAVLENTAQLQERWRPKRVESILVVLCVFCFKLTVGEKKNCLFGIEIIFFKKKGKLLENHPTKTILELINLNIPPHNCAETIGG